MVRIHDYVTAVAATEALGNIVGGALSELSPLDATDPDVLVPLLPGVVEVLGPAALYYPVGPLERPGSADRVEVVPSIAIRSLMAASAGADLEESGLASVASEASVIRDASGEVLAACAYQHWPESIAHIGVLTKPGHRGRGLGRAVAVDAIGRAQAEGLLPQWRARTVASRAVASAIGLQEMGAQLSLRVPNA